MIVWIPTWFWRIPVLEEEMEAITELVTTDDNLSPISSGNYPSYSAILARTWCSHCPTGGDGNFSVSLEWPTRRSTICVRGELGMRSVWYYCSFPSPIILNIGEASITSSEPQSALFWVVGIQLGLARLTRVDTAADTAVTLSLSLPLSLSITQMLLVWSQKIFNINQASRLAITRS